MKKIKFKRDFSLNGTWYKKDQEAAFDKKTADALIDKSIASDVKSEKSIPKKEVAK